MTKKKGAVIGIGGIGIWHGQMMRDTQRIEVKALCDANPAMAARAEEHFPGVPFYTSAAEMLAKESPDIVGVVVPHDLHEPIAVQVMEAGACAIVEKPMSTSYESCQRMIAASKKTGKSLTVFHNRRLDPWYLAAKAAIDGGCLGDLVEINIAINFSPTTATWRGWKQKSGGIMYDWGAHLVDYALHFADSPVKAVTGYFYNSPGRDPALNEEHGNVRIHFASGAIANVMVSGVGQAQPHRYFLIGTKGSLVDEWTWSDQEKLKVHSKLGGLNVVSDVSYAKGQPQKYYDNIADHLCDGKPLMVSAESAAKVINVFSTAERSFAQGGVPLPLAG